MKSTVPILCCWMHLQSYVPQISFVQRFDANRASTYLWISKVCGPHYYRPICTVEIGATWIVGSIPSSENRHLLYLSKLSYVPSLCPVCADDCFLMILHIQRFDPDRADTYFYISQHYNLAKQPDKAMREIRAVSDLWYFLVSGIHQYVFLIIHSHKHMRKSTAMLRGQAFRCLWFRQDCAAAIFTLFLEFSFAFTHEKDQQHSLATVHRTGAQSCAFFLMTWKGPHFVRGPLFCACHELLCQCNWNFVSTGHKSHDSSPESFHVDGDILVP